jgi:hypothetical protein
MASRLEKSEKKRVERAVAYVTKRVVSPIYFLVTSMSELNREDEAGKEENGILAICRSNRGQADRSSFLLYFDSEQTKGLTSNELRRTVWHEWLHAVTWDYTDEIENILKYMKSGVLKDELLERLYNTRENVTYNLERTLGPHVFPSFDWTEK